MAIKPLSPHYSFENSPSIYDEEAITALELAGRTAAKVNEAVEAFNELDRETHAQLDAQNDEIDRRMDAQDDAIEVMIDETMPDEVRLTVGKYIEQGAFFAQIDESLDNLNERVDNLLGSLTEGSTTGDAELIDIRTSASGTVAVNAGESVRGQVNDLREYYNRPNLITEKEIGYYNANNDYGWAGEKTHELTTSFIEIDPSAVYTISFEYPNTVVYEGADSWQWAWFGVLTFDADKTFLRRAYDQSMQTPYHQQLTFEEDVKYIRISWRDLSGCSIKLERGDYATPLEKNKSANLAVLELDGYYTDNGGIDMGDAELHEVRRNRSTRSFAIDTTATYTLYNIATGVDPWCCVIYFDYRGVKMRRDVYAGNTHRVIHLEPPAGAAFIGLSVRAAFVTDFALYKDVPENEMSTEQRATMLYLERLNEREAALPYAMPDARIKGIAHRGLSNTAPENTIPAFIEAAKANFKYVECDVAFTRDNIPVLLHDESIDRTSNGTGNIAEMTYAAASAYDFGSWFSAAYAGTKLPTLEEFLTKCRHLGLHAYIELKAATEAQLDIVLSTVRSHGMRGHVSYISFSEAVLQHIKTVDPAARLGYMPVAANKDGAVTVCKALKTDFNDVFINTDMASDLLNVCVENDIPLETWVVDSVSVMVHTSPYVSGFTSNGLNAPDILKTNALGVG